MQVIPPSILIDLKCRHCYRYVSCGPVHVIPSEGTILCGRCQMLAKQLHRNYVFEYLAQLFLYPCQFWSKHCPQFLPWNASLDHEFSCKYQGGCRLFCCKPGLWCSSDRQLTDIPEDRQLIKIPENFLEIIKCVFCEKYISCTPVYLTREGRNVCHRCVRSNGIPNGCAPNLAFEKLAECFQFPCIFRNRGCPFAYPFGGAIWTHESQCEYAPPIIQQKKPKQLNANGKEKGVIQTHSGHIYATITSQSILFAPPKNSRISTTGPNGKHVTKELEQRMKKKQNDDETRSFDNQSEASMTDGLSSSTMSVLDFDQISKGSGGNHVFDNVSRGTQSTLDYSTDSREPSLSSLRYTPENNGGFTRNSFRQQQQYQQQQEPVNFGGQQLQRNISFNYAGERQDRNNGVHRPDSLMMELKLKQQLKKREQQEHN